jgi:acetyl esterase/lipase
MLAKLPPLFLNAAGLDILLSDTLALAERLDAAEADYELVIHEGVHHSFMMCSTRLEEANDREGGGFRAEDRLREAFRFGRRETPSRSLGASLRGARLRFARNDGYVTRLSTTGVAWRH